MRRDVNPHEFVEASEPDISLGALFRCFLVIGVTGFGGVLPVVVHELVTRRHWMSHEDFSEVLSVCQILPGPNIVNISVVFGTRVAGIVGALAALSGLLLLPVAIGLTLATIYAGFSDLPQVRGMISAVASAAAGLLLAVAVRLFAPICTNPMAWIVGALVIGAVVWFRLPLVWVIVVLGPVSIGLTLWQMRDHG